MAEEGSAVKVVHIPVQDVAHTMKAARLLYSAPSYVLRGPIYMICVVTFAGLIYSFIGRVDTLVTCRLELKADYTKVQAPKRGTVRQVFVLEGAQIKPFTNLIEIQVQSGASDESESTILQRQLDKINDDLRWADKDKKDQQDRIVGLERSLKDETEKEGTLEERIQKEKLEQEAQVATANRKVTVIEANLKKALSAIDDRKRDVDSCKVRAENAKKRFDDEKAMVDKKLSTIQQLNTFEDAKNAADKALEDAKSAVRKSELDADNVQSEIDTAKATPKQLGLEWEQKQFRHNLERQGIRERKTQLKFDIDRAKDGLTRSKEQLDKQRKEIEEKIQKADIMKSFGVAYEGEVCRISSTYSGTVTNVFAKKDQQVGAGEVLFHVVKDTEPVYASVLVPNRDIGRVKDGLVVNIKYDAFPYQDFGIQKGSIQKISKRPAEGDKEGRYEVQVRLVRTDIVKQKEERSLAEIDPKAGAVLANEYIGKGGAEQRLPYGDGTTITDTIKEDLLRGGVTEVQVVVKAEPLTLGLQGFAEIKTGERRLIETIFTPVSRFFLKEE